MVMHPHTNLEWNNYLTLRSKVKVQTKVIMVHDTLLVVMHPHTKYHSPISKDKKCYGPNKIILFKKPLFDLQVKGQGPRKVIMIHDTPPYGHAPIPNIIDLSQKKQLFDLKVKDHYGMRHTALLSCTHIPNIIDLSRLKQLFDLEVKGQGPTKVITVRDTPPYGHTPTYQISLAYLKTKMLWSRQENTI